jgi:hypothetical protein
MSQFSISDDKHADQAKPMTRIKRQVGYQNVNGVQAKQRKVNLTDHDVVMQGGQ